MLPHLSCRQLCEELYRTIGHLTSLVGFDCAALNNEVLNLCCHICILQTAMRQDLSELEDMCNEVQAQHKSAKAAYEEVLAYFGETTNSTPSGNSAVLFQGV